MIINVFIFLEYEREVNMKIHHDRNEINQGRYTRTRYEFSSRDSCSLIVEIWHKIY